MSLSKKQESWILKNRQKFGVDEMSEKINADKNQIKQFLLNNPIKPTPKSFYLLAILIPVLFFVLLEISLNVIGYGNDYETFITVSEDYPDLLVLNPDLPKKYFGNSSFVPSVIPDFFFKEKTDSTFRIFIFGGSSAAGWPFINSATFSRHISRRLELEYPESHIEVINFGMSAVNSYTIKDIAEESVNHNPDLVLIYAGHNEYYGALGAGSKITFGDNPAVVNFIIKLREYKTTQLLTDVIFSVSGVFASDEKLGKNETLMGRMIGDGAIPINSDTYNNGIKQFEYNFTEILKIFNENEIPVIFGTLTSNYLLKPFVSFNENDTSSSSKFYDEAESLLKINEIEEAKLKFKYAKDLDGLRFRAPEKINEKIVEFGKLFNIQIANVNNAFFENSESGIVGYDLMVDHLHPNVKGYKLLADVFYKNMVANGNLPNTKKISFSNDSLNQILTSSFPYTKLDSVWSDFRVKKLTGAYPFVPKGKQNLLLRQIRLNDYADSLAADWYAGKETLASAHKKLATMYFNQKEYDKMIKEMDVVINDRKYNEINYVLLIDKLISINYLDEAIPYLQKLNKLNENDYTTKWLGSIALNKKELDKAVYYLKKSVEFKADAQTYYNLAGAYFLKKDIKLAQEYVKQALKISPDYQPAIRFYNSIKDM